MCGYLKKINRGLFLMFLMSLHFSLLTISAEGTEISLADAIKKGQVKVSIKGSPPDSIKNQISSYYGPCLLLNIQSTSKTMLNLRIESGRFLETADSSEQRMVITQDELIVLKPSGKKSINLFAMCTQMHERSPGKESLLAMGPMAEGNLLELTQFIYKNKFQSLAGQEAVWVVTDNNDVGSIYSDNKDEMNKLQLFVCKLTGKLPPPAPHSIFYTSGMVSGEIAFENKKRETYSFVMMNEAGEKIGTFFENRIIEKPMILTLTWRFRFKGFAKGVYYVKLINQENQVVANRPVVIN